MKEKYLVFVLLMILIGVVFFMVSSKMIDKKSAKIVDYDAKIKVAQEKLNSAKILDQQLSQFSIIIDNSLTKEKEFAITEVNLFKEKIGELAVDRRVAINKMSDSKKYSAANLIETTYILELEGTFVQIGQFISDLERLDRIVKIHALDITAAQIREKDIKEGVPQTPKYRVTIELSVFKVRKEA